MKIKVINEFEAIKSTYEWDCGDGCCSSTEWTDDGEGDDLLKGEEFNVDTTNNVIILTDYMHNRHRISEKDFHDNCEIIS